MGVGLLLRLERVLLAACLANLACLNCPGLSFQFFARMRKEPREKHRPDNFKRKTRGTKDSRWCPEMGPGPCEQMHVNRFVRRSVLRGHSAIQGESKPLGPPSLRTDTGLWLWAMTLAHRPLPQSWMDLCGCRDICGQLAREEPGGRPHLLLPS